MTTQDPELSAALGWPGGISNPVLARTQLLQMVAALRLASQQALEALEHATPTTDWSYMITAIRAALAQEQAEPDISRCPQCNGPADNGFDRSFPPSPYLCTKCMAEPVQPGAWVASKDGRVIYDDASADDGLLRVSGDFENDEQRFHYAQSIVNKLNTAPPKTEPAQEPVAWLAPRIVDSYSRPDLGYETCSKSDYGAFPAYTAPPQRKPLTEKEMYAVEEEARKNFRLSQKGPRGQQITYWDGLTPWLIRAVERAHGIKE